MNNESAKRTTLPRNIFYAQSGGPTAVINATAAAVIETARLCSSDLGQVFVGRHGILGALREELVDMSAESARSIADLRHTPASAFGSCRHRLRRDEEFQRLIEVFAAHDIGYFLYNGGNDSQDTTLRVAQMSHELGYPLQCIGLPKTIDNDLMLTDHCPGFGSAAKYIAVSTLEASRDIAAMAASSTKIFILEVMGRHAGWLAAAGGLAGQTYHEPPHLILFPEVTFDREKFLNAVEDCVKAHGFCVIVASEGIRDAEENFVASLEHHDPFGHIQLGGVAPYLAHMIRETRGFKYHWAVCDYLQRAAGHLTSLTDYQHAYAVGKAAIYALLQGKHGCMMAIEHLSMDPYEWRVIDVPLAKVAHYERKLPKTFIRQDGFGITGACRQALTPLITGEYYPPYQQGLPQHAKLRQVLRPKKCRPFEIA